MGLALAAALAACGPRTEQAEAPAPDAQRAITDPAPVVRALYEPYLVPDGRTPGLLDSAPWSARMRGELEAMMARSEALGEPILNFDPLINAQDWVLGDVNAVTEAIVEASHATVRASFLNGGHREEVVYDLIWEDDRWKVDNVRGSEWDLRAIVTAPAAP
jgi:hypothetical protein